MTMKRILSAVLVLAGCVLLTGCQNGPFRGALCDGYCQQHYSANMPAQQVSPMVYMPTMGGVSRGPCSAPSCTPCEACGVCDPCN